MTRLALGVVIGLGLGIVVAAAAGIHAAGTEPDEDTVQLAQEAGVSPGDVLGALNSLEAAGISTSARAYLIGEGLLAEPVTQPATPARPSPGWPIEGAIGQRIYCVEGIESHHGVAMWNPRPVWDGEHAQGWLGFLPSTARRWDVAIGNRASEWDGARRMILAGAGRQFYGIAAGIC